MLKIRRPLGRLIFNMGIAIPGKTVFLIETAPSVRLQGRVIGLGKAYISLAYFQLDMYDIYQNRKKKKLMIDRYCLLKLYQYHKNSKIREHIQYQ